MNAKLAVTAVMMTLVLAVAACAPTVGASPAKQANVEIGIDEFMDTNHIVREVVIADGGAITVSLGSNPSTGFSWTEAALVADPSLVRQTGMMFMAPEGAGLVGASGTQTWTFEALQRGTTSISMEYGRPWEGGEKAVWTFELTVAVK